jgi:hypothetical protein
MDTCAVEVGLLKKKPCGAASVARCANCEMALCTKHAVAQLSANKQRTGKFMCAECDRAARTVDTSPTQQPKVSIKSGGAPAPAAKPAAAPARPAPVAAKPSAPAKAGAAPAPAAAKPAAPAAKPAEEKFKLEDTGPIEFTPTKKP